MERKETPGLRRIILMDAFDSALVEHGKCCGVHVQAMQEVEVRCDGNKMNERKGLLLAQCKYQIYVSSGQEVVSPKKWPEGLFKENSVDMFSWLVVNIRYSECLF